MNPIVSQQAIALDNSLVAPEKRPKIERCNPRIAFTKPKKEETYQVTLEALKLSSCYPTFQITTKVPEIYMHQFWNTINKIGNTYAYNFKLDKKKCRVDTKSHLSKSLATLAVVKCYLQYVLIKCTRLGGHLLLSLTDCQKYGALIPNGMINDDIKLSTTYKTYIDYANGKVPPKKARKFKKPASPKLNTVPASPKEPTQNGKRVKRPAKKATTALTTGVVIEDTLGKSVSKKKAPAKTDRGNGIELLSDAALLKEDQLKKTLRKSKRETHKLQASGSSEGADFESEVPIEQTGKTKDTSKGTGVKPGVPNMSKEDSYNNDDDSCVNNSERTDSDDDENPSFTLKDYEEEEQDEEYVHTLEKDKSDDEEKMYKEEDDDVAMELEDQQNASHESRFEQEEDDGHMTFTTVHDKTEGTKQSSSVLFNFTSKLLNLDNTGPDVNEIASLMNTLTFNQRVSALETKMSKSNQTRQFAEAVSLIPRIVDRYLASKMKEVVDVVVRLHINKLKEEVEAENQEFYNQVDSTMKALIKDQVKDQVSKIMPQIKKYVTESLGVKCWLDQLINLKRLTQ
ncbi:hypothetical protein Tco_1457982 [Tanacetum coccineum]